MKFIVNLCLLIFFVSGCGKKPADFFRAQQLAGYDFPLYVSVGDGTGRIFMIDRLGQKSEFLTGLSDPQGLATDAQGNLYIVEQGNSRLLKVNTATKATTVLLTGLSTPSFVSLDSTGQVYVNEEGASRIVKVSDRSFRLMVSSSPSTFLFAFGDELVYGLFSLNSVFWGQPQRSSFSITKPVAMAQDILGRIFVSEGTDSQSRVIQIGPQADDGQVVVANGLTGALGVAVDRSNNLFVSETGESRIVLINQYQQLSKFADITAPLYLTLTLQNY